MLFTDRRQTLGEMPRVLAPRSGRVTFAARPRYRPLESLLKAVIHPVSLQQRAGGCERLTIAGRQSLAVAGRYNTDASKPWV
jgi:hypothetical protein